MISVEEAQSRVFALASPLSSETVPLDQAIGRYLAEDIVAKRSQPSADLSAMDGYAVRFADLPGPLELVGQSAAGAPFGGVIGAAEAVRIFTGAHVPAGANSILVQEDARSEDGKIFVTGDGPGSAGQHIRHKGCDFEAADLLMAKGTLLAAGAIAAVTMAGYGSVAVGGKPRIKIIATGDELVLPGENCGPAQIPSSNNIMLRAMLASLPCTVSDAGIFGDDLNLIAAAFADAADFDIIVTSGGASVGDHDFVQETLKAAGADIDFWRVAMRPGKPMMAGRIGNTVVLGLPGNPSSVFVTAFLFLLPLVRHLAGSNMPLSQIHLAPITVASKAGDNREEFMRARLENGRLTPFDKQDSGMLGPLIIANALIRRPAHSPPLVAGELTPYLLI